MDYRPREEEASLERVRESLIAISYCEPEKISDPTEHEKPNGVDKAVVAEAIVNTVDELRSKLMLIASDAPSMDSRSEADVFEDHLEVEEFRICKSTMAGLEMNDWKKIGLGLTGFGVFFSFLGIIFFFDKGLLAIGNILFISGVIMTIGIKSSLQFFMKRSNLKGTVSFGVGFFFVIIGWPVIGMASEAYGFIILFSGFWPTLAVFVQKIPVIGWVFQQPFIRSFFDRYRGRRVPV